MEQRTTYHVTAKGQETAGFAKQADAIQRADDMASVDQMAGELIQVHEVTIGPSDVGAGRTQLVYQTRG